MISHTAYPTNNNNVLIVAQTPLGKAEMIIGCSPEQYVKGVEAYSKGALIQNAFDFLNVEEREFLISGIDQARLDSIFDDDDSE